MALWAAPESGAQTSRQALSTIFRHEVGQTVRGLRFAVASLLLVAVMAFAAISGGARYRSAWLEQQAVSQAYAAQLSGVTIDRAAEILHPSTKTPWHLSAVVDGGQTATPDLCEQALSAQVAPVVRHLTLGNSRLPARQPLDWMFVLRVLLPLLAFLLGYDTVCGERKAGILKLLLSYPVARSKVLAGKLLALWTCLAVPLVLGAALNLGLARTVGAIPFTAADLGKALLVLLLGLWAALFFALVALLVSTISSDASLSLSVLTWLWVTGVIVAPAVSGLFAQRLRPIPTAEEIRQRLAAVDMRVARQYAGHEGHWRRPEWAKADGFAWEKVSAAAENQRAAEREEVRRGVLLQKIQQARLAQQLAAISPASLTDLLGEQVAGAGRERDESFLHQAWRFRDKLARSVAILDSEDPASPHVLFFSGYLSRRPLPAISATGAPGLPRFAFREISIRQGLGTARSGLAFFAAETLALAAAAFYSFSRFAAGDR
ncbi:MAG TPA: ABC transporter permease [Thermoanaerobaculia bacterium]|nr:ABC transporter permease [Thermoanaerobaculia bacterium]